MLTGSFCSFITASHWKADGEAVCSSDILVFTSQFSHCLLNSSCWRSSQVWMWVHHCNIFFWTENCNEQHNCVTKLSLLICDFSVTNTQVIFRMYNIQVFSYHHKESMNFNFKHQKTKISVRHQWNQVLMLSFLNSQCFRHCCSTGTFKMKSATAKGTITF